MHIAPLFLFFYHAGNTMYLYFSKSHPLFPNRPRNPSVNTELMRIVQQWIRFHIERDAYLADMKLLKKCGIYRRWLYHREMLSRLPVISQLMPEKSTVYNTRDTIRKSKNTQGKHPKIPGDFITRFIMVFLFSRYGPLAELSRMPPPRGPLRTMRHRWQCTQARALISIFPIRGAKGRRRARRKRWHESHFH